jgi:hypothetical protein
MSFISEIPLDVNTITQTIADKLLTCKDYVDWYALHHGLNRRGTDCFMISEKALLCQSNDMSFDSLIIS